jgi:hypothetical protein
MYSRALAAWNLENASSVTGGSGKGDKKASAAAAASASPLYTGVVQPPSLPSAAAGHSMLDAEEQAALAEAQAASGAAGGASHTSASYLLQQALLMWPSALAPLLTAAGSDSLLTRPAWVAALSALTDLYAVSGLFSSSSAPPATTPYLSKLELCFAERSGSLWKGDRLQAFILANAQQLASALAAKPSLYTDAVRARFSDARQRLLMSLPFPRAVRELQKSSYSDHVAHLPPELLMAQQHAQHHVLDLGRARREQQHAADMAAAGQRPLDLAQSPLRAFVQSLLPWFTVPGQGPQADADLQHRLEQELAVMPQEQREQLIAHIAAGGDIGPDDEEEDEGEEEEDDAALAAAIEAQGELEEQQGLAERAAAQQGGIDYQDYQFDDDEEEEADAQ